MKKMKQVFAVFMCAIALISSIGGEAFAAEAETSSKIKVYDSAGNLIEELDSMEELAGYNKNEKGAIGKIIIRLLKRVGEALVVDYLASEIKDAFAYLRDYHITIPTVNPGDTITVYSLDGNIYNPYPPNSYQGATWEKTNFRVVVS